MTKHQIIKKIFYSIKYLFTQENFECFQSNTRAPDFIQNFYIDIMPKRNCNAFYLNLLLGVPKFNELQAASFFKIDAIDFGFTDIAYGAWRPRIL